MFFSRLTFASMLLLATLVGPVALGQTSPRAPQGDVSSRASLVAERQRVRGELERANAEIDALKRSGRGLREDYRLRERLADAEALARRLTELDARLGGAPATTASGPGAVPRVSASDGPAELDAKADILADQAQRLAARGDQLLGRAHDLRARQTLRRRVGQMERDPFSPLEGSKRRAMTGSVALSAGAPGVKSTPAVKARKPRRNKPGRQDERPAHHRHRAGRGRPNGGGRRLIARRRRRCRCHAHTVTRRESRDDRGAPLGERGLVPFVGAHADERRRYRLALRSVARPPRPDDARRDPAPRDDGRPREQLRGPRTRGRGAQGARRAAAPAGGRAARERAPRSPRALSVAARRRCARARVRCC